MKLNLHYSSALVVAVVGAAISVAVSFGLHLTQDNINSVLTLVGLVGAAITIGGGAKTAGALRNGISLGNLSFHFTGATILAVVGALIAVLVSFGMHMTQENIDSIMKLVGLLAGGAVVGGGIKSAGMFDARVHPLTSPHQRAKLADPKIHRRTS